MYNNELYHHGILGQKWGVRHFQNKDGSLTAAGLKRYGKEIQKLEQKKIDKNYKDKGQFVFKSARTSTGKHYDELVDEFTNSFSNDAKYKTLSKKAFDAEQKRLKAEKDAIDKSKDQDLAYEKLMRSKEYKKLYDDSVKASRAKSDYVENVGKSYYERVKDAKIKDLNITENVDLAKKFLKNNFKSDFNYYWDGNLEYNPDSYWEDYDPNRKFK